MSAEAKKWMGVCQRCGTKVYIAAPELPDSLPCNCGAFTGTLHRFRWKETEEASSRTVSVKFKPSGIFIELTERGEESFLC
jgi:hypothetical protein